MNRQLTPLRYIMVLTGIVALTLGIGFAFNLPWATALWPWPDGPLSFLFVGSILAAISIAFIWIGFTAEWGATAAGALTVLVMTAGQAAFLFLLAGQPNRQGLLPFAVWFALVALASVGAFVWSRRFPIRDIRPLPRLLQISYLLFVAILLLSGAALTLGVQIFPWQLKPDSAVIFGWIFLGDACYFLYSFLNPRWHNARGQLLSFLVYDVFLIPRFLGMFGEPNRNLTALVIYLLVLLYSGMLAVYYLFIDPRTRPWAIQEQPTPQRAASPPVGGGY
ncbi:MAG: hypothetical protein DLM69_03445 [Candidatus Chloroheliales bacterium]|nr:MAG: hypothetical protein DLM69_03445 [Chloroflexota bacterium]